MVLSHNLSASKRFSGVLRGITARPDRFSAPDNLKRQDCTVGPFHGHCHRGRQRLVEPAPREPGDNSREPALSRRHACVRSAPASGKCPLTFLSSACPTVGQMPDGIAQLRPMHLHSSAATVCNLYDRIECILTLAQPKRMLVLMGRLPKKG